MQVLVELVPSEGLRENLLPSFLLLWQSPAIFFACRNITLISASVFTWDSSLCESRVCIIVCPSADEWTRKLWYIYAMEYYSAIKKNSFESVLMRWMKLEPIIQSEVSEKDKDHYNILTHIYGI